MLIELKEKRVIKQRGGDMSYCLVLYRADGVSMHQYVTLNNELPNEMLLQMCEVWAKHYFSKHPSEKTC